MKFELRLTALYVIVGAAWILFSDQLVALLPDNHPWHDTIQTYKGWFYVALTGGLLYFLLRREIHLRQAALEQVRSSEQQFRTLFAHNPLPMWVYHQQTLQFLDVNDTAIQQYGYSADEFRQMTLTDIRPEDEGSALLNHTTQEHPAQPDSGEWRHRRKDGSVFPVEIVSHTVNFNGVPAVLVVAQDLSEREQLAVERTEGKRLRMALNKEIEVRELKNRFLSMVAHEFRTPLTTIALSSDMLIHQRQKLSAERQNQHLHKIQDQVLRLTEMMEDILQLTRTEVVKPEFKPEPHNIEELCNWLVEEMRSNLKAGQQLTYRSTVGEPPLMALDSKQMEQALSNILSNAIKYSPEDTTISVDTGRQDDQFVIRIRDQGIGIPEQDLPRLFEPFQRAANVGRIPGSGLGLAITKQAIEMHGGTITVESEPDKGSTFIIHLPMVLSLSSPQSLGDGHTPLM